jgi:hypothetical protein
MKHVLWTPQHEPTPEQVSELRQIAEFGELKKLSNIAPDLCGQLQNCPAEGLDDLARRLYSVCQDFSVVILPIGSPAFMWKFSIVCSQVAHRPDHGHIPVWLFAHSIRESRDEPQSDGSVKKTSVFRHERFIRFE